MKNLKLLLVLLLTFSFFNVAQAQKLGLVSQLLEIKYSSDIYLKSVLMEDPVNPTKKNQAVEEYYKIREIMNSTLYQLMADMRSKNSAKRFRRLNKYYRTHSLNSNVEGGLEIYKNEFKKLNSHYERLKNIALTGNPDTPAANPLAIMGLIDDLGTDIITVPWSIIKESSELREKKVTNLISILEALMINAYVPTEKKTKTITETITDKDNGVTITKEVIKEEKTVTTTDQKTE